MARKEEKAKRREELEESARVALESGRKACVSCGEVKPLEAFWVRKKALDGRTRQCGDCINAVRNRPDPEDEERVSRWKMESSSFEDEVERMRRLLS